eukprot:TRINITY_DN9691_c0_g1_i1.p1 TRINITY_DN9691_c0_g1~~TRINITY_DN9691_c0_g1_i1.p1  ORF type:complete len:964 (-),score=235.15 TRINITY_DN9691_c0_g1_i1:148-3039(-)
MLSNTESILTQLDSSTFQWDESLLPAESKQGDINTYLANMMRKAITHSASQYKFVTQPPQPVTEKMPAKKMAILVKTYEKNWKVYQTKLEALNNGGDVVSFLQVQEEIMKKIHQESRGARPPIVIESCRNSLGPLLLKVEETFEKNSCPRTGNDLLFNMLSLVRPKKSAQKPATGYAYYERQFSKITEIDRNLKRQPDLRCEGFEPTLLQRQIMDSIDSQKNIVVRSPASSGKTMLSLYLAQKKRDSSKVTLYIGPNKPVCHEFSLFVYNQGLKFAIGTEDFFNWSEMMDAEVMICTPQVFLRMLFFPQGVNLFERIGAVIFDEFPAALESFKEQIEMILMVATVNSWQTMIVSATLANDVVEMLSGVMEFTLLEPKDSIRPTDLIIHQLDGKKYVPAKTSDYYSESLLTSENPLAAAINLPVSLGEFRDIFGGLKTHPQRDEILKNSLPRARCVIGADLTRFALETKKTDLANNTELIVGAHTTQTPTPQDIFEMLEILDSQDLLPALFFHADGKVLDSYHSTVTTLVEQKFEEAREKAEALRAQCKTTSTSKPKGDDQEGEGEETGFADVVNTYGIMEDPQLAEIFKHRSDHSKSAGKGNIKFGFRGKRVKKSNYYPGIKIGLGIHHHAVESGVRDAVESGLRLGHLRVVFCDHNMALGLNMPVKTVVFLASDEEKKIYAHQFIQASGRAGRWGRDKFGAIIFAGYTPEVIKTLWDPLLPISHTFPVSLPLALSLCSGSELLRKNITKGFSLTVPAWNWTPENAKKELASRIQYLQTLGLLNDDLSPTKAGTVAIPLVEEGMISIVFGYVWAKFKDVLIENIVSSKDFLFVVCHFLSKEQSDFGARGKRQGGPTLTEASLGVSDGVRKVMSDIIADIHTVPSLKVESAEIVLGDYMNATEKTTAIAFRYPDISEWETLGWSNSEMASYVSHLLSRVIYLQKLTQLPFGQEAIEALGKSMGK